MRTVLRRVQQAVLVCVVVWVAVHTVLGWQLGWTPWRLGGFGMYAEPSLEYRSSAVVACDSSDCADEKLDAAYFAPTLSYGVPLLEPTPDGPSRYRLVGTQTTGLGKSLAPFRRLPSQRRAEGLVRDRVADACGPYLVVFYKQNVSMISRQATVSPRLFVVNLPSDGCTRERRVD